MTNKKLALAIASLVALSGCATPTHTMRVNTHQEAYDTIKMIQEEQEAARDVTAQVAAKYIEFSPDYGPVSLKSSSLPVYQGISTIANQYGYSMMVMEGINTRLPVAVDLKNLTPEAAMRRIALSAGYVAIIDSTNKTVTLSTFATDTFKVPLHVMQQLEAKYKVGGNPVSSSSGSSGSSMGGMPSPGGMGGSSGSEGGGIAAEFTVSGKFASNSGGGIKEYIKNLAGRNADVDVLPESGLITVRSNAMALKRVHDFITKFANNAQRRVDVEASIVDIELGDQFEYGLDWTKILRGNKVSLLGAGTVATPSATATITTASISTVINALSRVTNTKVISQPRVTAMNQTPAVIFNGTQIPYVPSIMSTTTGVAGTVSNSGSVAYAVDGVTLSILPDIISDREVDLSFVPVINNVQGFQTFNLGGTGQVTGAIQGSKTSYMDVLAESGKTVILGGSRYSSGSRDRSGLPGVNQVPVLGHILASNRSENETHREVLVLLRANIIQSPKIDPLFSESL